VITKRNPNWLHIYSFASAAWIALLVGALALLFGFTLESTAAWIIGCLSVALGMATAVIALCRGEPMLAKGGLKDRTTDETAYHEPPQGPHSEAVAALGDHGEVRPPSR
jgi:hypothetical protein